MSDNTSVSVSSTALDIRRGDVIHHVGSTGVPVVVVRYDGFTITTRAWRWYDGPRLWLRALPHRVSKWCWAFIDKHFEATP